MSTFTSEADLLKALSAHDELVRGCARGDVEFRDFVRLYDDFWWRYALDGHESDRAEQRLLERHASRLLVHQKIAEEVLGSLAPANNASKQSYERAGRIPADDALFRLKQIASEFLDR